MDVRPGEVVALVAENGPGWLDGYRALLAAGAVPLLLDPSSPAAERERWLALAGATRTLAESPDGELRLLGTPSEPRNEPGGVLLCTSGSTGSPKLVRRGVGSLDAEGRRYVTWAPLTPDDRVALPLPMWHAFALGWVHAAAEAGCALHAGPPGAPGRTLELVNDGCTVLALVPSTVSPLAARAARGLRAGHSLRLAVVGAGPVSADLERRFRDAFGVGLSRNYGSTETGALFAGRPGCPDAGIGVPMDGVEARIVDADGAPMPDGEAGTLQVRVDAGEWYDTGDVALFEPGGGRIVGRRTRALRRGDRWVAPEEVEAVAGAHPEVVDARCRTTPGAAGSTLLEMDVVSVRTAATDLPALRDHLRTRLAPHKVPDRIRVVPAVPRGGSGKVLPEPVYRLGDEAALVAEALAYKRSELVFALLRLGVLDLLTRGPSAAAAIAAALGLDRQVCDVLLETAAELGIVRPDRPDANGGPHVASAPILRLEDLLSRSFVTRERLVDMALGKAGDTGPEEISAVYQAAMNSPAAERRTRLGLALAGYRPSQRLLEVACGPGRYARAAGTAGRLLRVGPLSPPPDGGDPEEPEPDERFDVVVVSNAVHLSDAGSDLAGLAARLTPGGRLLFDDVFLAVDGGIPGVVRLDWLTHGGLYWPTVAALERGLARVGLSVRRAVPTGTPAVTLLLATAGEMTPEVPS
ncbi:AMP-binding protein [Dactylosporangium sp. NPDC049140]|uniref:AMP-binding protein n=1 Tax=Dactylosporangium sp. NPDC049140 TaxID=3155647 RepID=UPI0033C42E6A